MAAKVAANGKGFQPDTDVHVTLEDQTKINKFAKYNANLEDLKDELQVKKNDLKNLEEAGDEIELFDEDEQIPFVFGEVFISHNLSKTQELIAAAKEKKKKEIEDIQEKCKQIQEWMSDLKAQLYLRFGTNIYLENDE
ncbi:probable prefoldin subunit 4 [Sitodiplosis mosellana]|uniref:probable prefoldin subunit 4 n=1 Tax=Sitodiplosis mosellana TaxID=263140 RepID=UPI0024446447|nr:probable prefoldin subunit 4 [Sitodiplosis mosellana]